MANDILGDVLPIFIVILVVILIVVGGYLLFGFIVMLVQWVLKGIQSFLGWFGGTTKCITNPTSCLPIPGNPLKKAQKCILDPSACAKDALPKGLPFGDTPFNAAALPEGVICQMSGVCAENFLGPLGCTGGNPDFTSCLPQGFNPAKPGTWPGAITGGLKDFATGEWDKAKDEAKRFSDVIGNATQNPVNTAKNLTDKATREGKSVVNKASHALSSLF